METCSGHCSQAPGHPHPINPAAVHVYRVLWAGVHNNVLLRAIPPEVIDCEPIQAGQVREETDRTRRSLRRNGKVFANSADRHWSTSRPAETTAPTTIMIVHSVKSRRPTVTS